MGVILLACHSLFAFLPPEDAAGPLTLTIAGPGEVKALGQPLRFDVTLKNSGDSRLDGTVRLAVIDDWRVAGGGATKTFSAAAHASESLSFDVIPGKGSYAALYPVHAYAEFHDGAASFTAHAILIASVSPSAIAPAPHWPVVTVATLPPKPEPAADRLARRQKAIDAARAALHGKAAAWSWKLESSAGVTGAAVAPGPCGLADAFIAFVDDRRELVFDGFTIDVDGTGLDLACQDVGIHFDQGRGTVTSHVRRGNASLAVQASLWAEKGGLRIAFAMPGAQRDLRGEPRFTALGIGPASERARRVYAGFGNVLQDPAPFDLPAGGFTLSTRHVGIDFANGLSLVQATDVFPDRFHVDPDRRAYSLVAQHDATFSFIPSTRQAFAAARVYHDLAGFQPAGGVAKLLGRICLDQWGGDYRAAAQDLDMAARYGVTDAVFVKHDWQRWGYDYRLPDIYPPAGDFGAFRAMADACVRHGILFAPHDNYIDFYPDATGYSYDHILFNEDGTPQKAWFNAGRGRNPTGGRPTLSARGSNQTCKKSKPASRRPHTLSTYSAPCRRSTFTTGRAAFFQRASRRDAGAAPLIASAIFWGIRRPPSARPARTA